MKAHKILVVDDESWARDMMREMLEREGYQVSAVGSGEEALRRAKEERFDLLLADIIMPRMDGLELVREFREVSPETIPLLITGYASIETAQVAMRQGVYDYIVKPFDRADLCSAVAKALRRKKLADEDSRLKELVGLYKVSQSMITAEEQREVLESVLNVAVHQTKCIGGTVLLFDTSRQGLVIAAALGAWEPAARVANAMLEAGIDVWTDEIRDPLLLTDVDGHPLLSRVRRWFPAQHLVASRLKGVEMMLLPIKSEKEIFGVLNVYKEGEAEPLGESDLELLTILATQAGASIKSRQLFSELEKACLATLCSIASWVDSRSLHTRGHMGRVAQLSEQLGLRISLSQEEIKTIKLGAMLHDIGLIGVSESILNMPGELTPQEWEIVKLHPVIGDELLSPLRFLAQARHIVRHHHERWDGSGYPDGLSREELAAPLQVVSLCDSYVAMTSPRPWRQALSQEEAIAALQEEKGTKSDPEMADAFIDMITEST